jgi:hypothetical protein
MVFHRVAVHVGTHRFPLWPSVIAVLILGGLAIWLWKVSYASDKK